jgi:Type IV secretion-system coupling protein DNA-binding domain
VATARPRNGRFQCSRADHSAFAIYPCGTILRLSESFSDSNTSRDYLAGLSQTQLPAFACNMREGYERESKHTGDSVSGRSGGWFWNMNHESDIIIGTRVGWGDPVPFGISPADSRQHVYVIGKTGSGKTTLLLNMIVQHIAQGHGVGLIDPHGDLAEELLNHVPPCRTDHLCYFNPSDLEFPIGLNLLANVAPDDRHLVASGNSVTWNWSSNHVDPSAQAMA